jgi:hypothetical protein
MFKRKSLKLFIILRQAAEYLGFGYDISNSWKKTVKSEQRLFYWLKGGSENDFSANGDTEKEVYTVLFSEEHLPSK